MPPTTPRREVIEITDSPIAWPEFIEISDDDEVTELLDYRGKSDMPQYALFNQYALVLCNSLTTF